MGPPVAVTLEDRSEAGIGVEDWLEGGTVGWSQDGIAGWAEGGVGAIERTFKAWSEGGTERCSADGSLLPLGGRPVVTAL